MSKLSVLLLISLLAGCAGQQHSVDKPDDTNVAVPSAPVFETGTSIEQLRRELAKRNIPIVKEWPDHIVIHSSAKRDHYVYGFSDGVVVLGPSTFVQVQRGFVSADLSSQNINTLHQFATADETDPAPYNEFARLLAAYPDVSFRDPTLAIELATRANELSNWQISEYVDTLAAAYASAGEFSKALQYQEQAIDLLGGLDIGLVERKVSYRFGIAYKAPKSYFGTDEGEERDEKLEARQELLADAADGSADAQFDLAVYYLTNSYSQSGGIKNPGLFWLKQAALNGSAYAANEMGWCHLMQQYGCSLDAAEALHWFEIAANQGDPQGAYNFGRMQATGLGSKRDDVGATRWLTAAADGGHSTAAFKVAFRYGEGVGTAIDTSAKNKYLQQTERANYGPGDYLLDDVFFQSNRIGASIVAMLERTAVAPGEMASTLMTVVDTIANASIEDDDTFVLLFKDGEHVEYAAKYKSALMFHLTRIAASLGSRSAQLRFAKMHEQGALAKRSPEQAHYWQQRANSQE